MQESHKIRLYYFTNTLGGGNSGFYVELLCEAVHSEKDLAWFKDYEKALLYAKLKTKELNLELIDEAELYVEMLHKKKKKKGGEKKVINLGDKVRDRITGYEGIVTAKCEYLNGCVQFAIQAKKTKEGKLPKTEWIDDIQLKVIAEKTKLKKDDSGGGMRNHPF